MQSVFAYVTLDEAFGSNVCTVKMAPKWTVFLIFPKKVIYLPRANAPISLVWTLRKSTYEPQKLVKCGYSYTDTKNSLSIQSEKRF